MAKSKSQYICSQCGYQSPKWMGKCPGCSSWNTLTETIISDSVSNHKPSASRPAPENLPKSIKNVEINRYTRFSTGIGELDRVLGGGIVKGFRIFEAGE